MTSTNTHNITKSAYPYLMSLFCAIVILGNIYALKITSFFSFLTPSGMLCFPFTFSINDIITERYGEKAAAQTVKMGLITLIIYFITLHVVTGLEPAPGWGKQKEWESIFSSSAMIFLGTLSAYYLGEKVNYKLLSKLKTMFNERFFLRRSLASTFVGVTVDTIIFNIVAFFLEFPLTFILFFTANQLILKLGFEILGSCLASITLPLLIKLEASDSKRPSLWINKYLKENNLDN